MPSGREEPAPDAWRPVDDKGLRAAVGLRSAERHLVLVDGRSGGGKSTFADRLAAALGGAAVVHTDDIAWNLHPTDWAQVLHTGVIAPWRRGERVSFRPPGWVAHGRPGAVELPPAQALVVEGVGAGRAELAAVADLVVWVWSDRAEAKRRGLARDVALGRTPEEAAEF